MQRMNILQRVAITIGLLVGVAVIWLGVGVVAFLRLNAATVVMLQETEQHIAFSAVGKSFDEQAIAHLGYLSRPTQAGLEEYEEFRAETLAQIEGYQAAYDSPEAGEWQVRLAAINRAIDDQFELLSSGDRDGAYELEDTAVQPGHEDLERLLEGELEILDAQVAAARAEVEANRRFATIVFVSLGGFAVLGGILAFAYIGRSATRPLNEAIGVLSSSSAELAASVSEVTATVEELSRTASQIAESADRVAHSAEENLRNADTAHLAVEETVTGIDTLKQTVRALAERILALGEKAQQIGVVVNIINDFADDTHLLALNASIEAAGAGEHGKRFAVVAAEVKRLAERVVQATGEIRVLVGEVQSATNAAVMSAEATAREAERGATVAGRSGAAINEILQQVSATSELAKEISLATQQQQQASEQVARTMHDVSSVAQQTANTGRELAAGIGQKTDRPQGLAGRPAVSRGGFAAAGDS